jgi:ArsR family transcriptional regulator, arsenate/arsenite/antimonite-responsive transcriptional repressor
MARRKTAEPAAEACCRSVLEAPLADADAQELARAFAALADPVRLRLLGLVAAAGEVCSCDLVPALGKSQPTVSHHTKTLADVGLIVGDKRGRWVWWSIVPERLQIVRDALAVPADTVA